MSEFDKESVEDTELNSPVNGSEEAETDAEKAKANKPAEEAALEEAAAKSGANVSGEGLETETEGEIYFEGRKVLRVLPQDQQTPAKGFVRCFMSDSTTVDVPEGLFGEGDLAKLREEAEAATEEAEKKSEDEE